MAAANSTPIQLYYSNTPGSIPPSTNLIIGELGFNVPDGIIYYLDSSNNINVVARTAASAGKFPVVTFLRDNTTQYTAAAPFAQTNTIYNLANTNATNITLVQGVDSYQNTLITTAQSTATSAGDYGNGAFIQANTGVSYAVTAGSYANSAYSQANLASSIATLAGLYANNAWDSANSIISSGGSVDSVARSYAVTAGSYANSAYSQANTATSYATTAGSYGNSAYNQANTATSYATTAGSYANSAYVQANTNLSNITNIENVNLTQNTNIQFAWNTANSAGTYANGAFIQANIATSYATTAGDYANSGFTRANSAYNKANNTLPLTGGTVTGAIVVNTGTSESINTSGPVYVGNDLTVTGNIYLSGTSTTYNSNVAVIQDPMIYLASNNTSDVVDIGFYGNFVGLGSSNYSHYQHTGFVRDYHDRKWKLFSNVPEPSISNTYIDFTNAIYDTIKVGTIEADYSNIAGYDVLAYTNSAFSAANSAGTNAITAGSYANSAFAQANIAYTVGGGLSFARANSAFDQANLATSYATTAGSYANSAFAAANTKISNVFGTVGRTFANVAVDTTNVTVDLYTTGVANGTYTYPQVTVDSYGRITNISNQTPVTSFNSRTGNITLNSIDVTTALDYTPVSFVVYYDYVSSQTNLNNSQNTNISTAGSYANSAFGVANTANTNSITAGNYANSAFGVANTANTNSITAGSYANSAFGTANSAGTYANGAFIQANIATSYATTAGDYANSAYSQANTGTNYATYAGTYANGAFIKANTAFTNAAAAGNYANSAFTKANTAFVLNNQTVHLGDTANISSIWSTSYESPLMVVPMISDPAWAFGANSYGAQVWLQGQFWGGGDTNHGFRLYDSFGNGNTRFFVDGTGNAQADKFTATTIRFADGTSQTTAYPVESHSTANSAGVYANGAFIMANSGYGQANSASTYANGAFTMANSGYGQANTASTYANSAFVTANSAGVYANGAFVTANSAGTYANGAFVMSNASFNLANTNSTNITNIQGVDLSQNASISSAFTMANAAFSQANSEPIGTAAFVMANASFNLANTINTILNIEELYSNGAYSTANSAGSYANSAFIQANAAFDYANTISSSGSSIDAWSRNQANASYDEANTAAVYANAAFLTANSAYNTANAAFNSSNTSLSLAQSSFNKANSIVSPTYYTGTTPPANPSTSAIWYNTATDVMYEWITTDGTNYYWVDIDSPTVTVGSTTISYTYTGYGRSAAMAIVFGGF